CFGVAGDGNGHDADRPGSGDQHVLADQVERQRRVRGVSERVEDGRHLVGDRVRQLEDVECWHRDVIRERARTADADADSVAAEVPPAGAAVAVDTAGDVSFGRYAVAGGKPAHLAAAFNDYAGEFVADRERHGNRL